MSSHDEDKAVAEELKAHHRVMIEYLARLSRALAEAAGSGIDGTQARRNLQAWIRDILVPHANEEEVTTYQAAGKLPKGTLLIRSMLAEHELIRQMAAHVSAARSDIEAAAYGRALFEIFDAHQRKENDLILPLLVESNAVCLAEVMDGAHAKGRDPHHNH